MRRQETGFTLIELVIVLVILGILAAVAVPQFYDAAADAKAAAAGGGKSAVASGIATYTARTKVPPTGTQLATDIGATGCSFSGTPIIQLASGTAGAGVRVTTIAQSGAAGAACAMTVVGVSASNYVDTGL